MNFSKRNKYALIGLLIILGIVIRVPSVPHEIGVDSFTIHILANSVSTFGEAKWWIHPLSIGGFYPCSYASAVPFILSGISQCTDVDMERVIWIFCLIIGLLSAATAYTMVGQIKNDDFFKFLVAFGYSLSPALLVFTWDASTRGLFIVLLPLFIYLLLKTRTSLKYVPLTFILFMVLIVTHHYFYLTIPFIFIFIIFLTFNKFKNHVKFITISNNFVNIILIIGFLIVLAMPFFTRTLVSGSRYTHLQLLLENNIRYFGVVIVFSIGGLIYLTLKHDKKFEEWFLLLALLCLSPFMYSLTYAHFVTPFFGSILAGISLTNIANVAKIDKQKKKYVFSIIIILLLCSVGFSGFYQHWRTGATAINYMSEETYSGALWIKDSINTDKRLVGDGGYDLLSRRIFAISEVPTLLVEAEDCMLTYGFINITDINISKNSPLSVAFYMDNPYVSTYKAGAYRNMLQSWEINSWWGKRIISKFNLSYVIENEDIEDNTFIRSVHIEKDNVYDNGKIRVWSLD